MTKRAVKCDKEVGFCGCGEYHYKGESAKPSAFKLITGKRKRWSPPIQDTMEGSSGTLTSPGKKYEELLVGLLKVETGRSPILTSNRPLTVNIPTHPPETEWLISPRDYQDTDRIRNNFIFHTTPTSSTVGFVLRD